MSGVPGERGAGAFGELGLDRRVVAALQALGHTTPLPIQTRAIPPALEGRDVVASAETGTGKTLAFLLPIFHKLKTGQSDPQALVVCPTRELAIQVAGEAERFGQHMGVRTVLTYGGTSSGDQKRRLAEGCDLVVGTPGRLLDFVTSAWLSLRRLRTVVLDEADRMLDMGFIDDVDAILRKSPMSRQTALFSATFPEQIRRLAHRYMFHPKMVRMHTGTRVTKQVDHSFYPVNQAQKESLLVAILESEQPRKTLVFTATREATSEVAMVLRRARHDVISLSSLLSQANRERALSAFREGRCEVLVATDVAARGLDITDIDLVVNFDVPTQAQDYVHRIGRTGRADREGKAVTLVSERDRERAEDIDRLLGGDPVPRLRLEGFSYQAPGRDRDRDRGRGERKRPARGARARAGGHAGRERPGGQRSRRGSGRRRNGGGNASGGETNKA